jgi:tetratricopeptide (TPR) repeat protein
VSFRLCSPAILVLVLVVAFCPAAAPPPRPPTPAEINRWVEDLGADEFDVREAASAKLRAAGPSAEAALEKATAGTDREVVRRALAILADFRWGIYPDTPEAVIETIRDYKGGNREDKDRAVRKLVEAGAPGWRALLRILKREEDATARRVVLGTIAGDLNHAVPLLLQDGNLSPLGDLLEHLLAEDPRLVMSNYTAFWLLRGELPARIAEHQAQARKKPDDKVRQEILVHLLRAKGDLPGALKAAEASERNDLIEAILYEMGDWKTLAARPELMGATHPVEKRARQAAYHRLAGNTKEFAALIADLRKLGEEASKSENPGSTPLHVAKSLFLNAHPKQALEELARSNDYRWQRLEVLLARYDFRAARALMDEARKAESPDGGHLEVIWARNLYLLGDKDEAIKIFKTQGERIKKDVEFAWFEDLIDNEMRCGLADLAFEHAGKILDVSEDNTWPGRLFEKLFSDRKKEAEALYSFLQMPPRTPASESLRRVRSFLTGKGTAKDLTDLSDQLKKRLKDAPPQPLDSRIFLALGESAHLAKLPTLARECLERGKSAETFLRLGDFLAEQKEWTEAAKWYHSAYRLGVQDMLKHRLEEADEEALVPLALYLSGWALEKAGQAETGRKRMEQSHWLPLGNERVRASFVRALLKRNHLEAARKSNDIIRKTAEPALHEPDSLVGAEATRIAAVDAAAHKEHLASALMYEQAALRCLRPEIYFARPVAYSAVPGFIHRHRALGLFGAGKIEAALAEIDNAQAAQPGGIDLPVDLVEKLERAGRKKEADRLYKDAQGVVEAIIKDYPKCGWAYNSAAWLSACCRRDLEAGLKQARKAVELSPDNAGYLDTLAEVLFQLGKKDEAMAVQKKAVELSPGRKYFRKQLARIEAGNPKVDRPADEDE